jgi:hypothetical protein
MNLREARVAFRDRTLADVLDLAVRFLAVHAKAYAKVALFTLGPGCVLSLLCGAYLGWTRAWLVAVPLAVFAEAPFTILASQLVFEDSVRARDVLRASLTAAPRVLVARVIGLLMIAAGLGCFFVPGIGLAAMTLFVSETMLLERAGMMTAFGRAQRVAGNAMGDVVLAILVIAFVPPLAVLITDFGGRTLLGEVLQFRPPRAVWTEGGSALGTLGLFLQVPFLATARFFLYLNVRTRTEGWDIQTRFARLMVRE